jgi:hypothetical protein
MNATPEFLDYMIPPKLNPDCDPRAFATEIYDGEAGPRHVTELFVRHDFSPFPSKFVRKRYRTFQTNSQLVTPCLL